MSGGIIIKQITAARGHVQATFIERLAEWLLALQLCSWGLILLRTEETFGLSRTMMPLSRIASEEAWGTYAALVGGIRVLALFINGWVLPHTYLFRIATSFASVICWLTITLGLFNAGTASTALAIYPWCLMAELVCLYRVGRDYAHWRDIQAATKGA
jgi:hypothetical protein